MSCSGKGVAPAALLVRDKPDVPRASISRVELHRVEPARWSETDAFPTGRDMTRHGPDRGAEPIFPVGIDAPLEISLRSIHSRRQKMRIIPLFAAGALLIAVNASASAAPAFPNGVTSASPAIVLIQDKPKKGEGITAKVKRAWKKLTGYHFDVSCITGRTTCSETGKNAAAAQSKCIARHPACWVENKR
jgi:hypothetical protein